MWFKNLYVYALQQDWTLPPGGLEQVLAKQPLQPCAALALSSRGWVPPAESPALVHGLDRHALIALGTEDKLLPGSVINDAAAEHAAAWEKSHGLKPGRKLMRDFKDRATTELLPRAFVRRRRTRAWIDPGKRRLVIDVASATRAETLTETLRETLGGLEIVVPTATHAPSEVMTGWLRAQQAPGRFQLGEDCELTGSDPSKPVVRYVRHPLVASQLQRHFDDGFRVSRVALTWNNRLSLMVDDKLQIRRLRFLDIDETGRDGGELSAQDRFDAEFALMTHDVAALLDDLHEAFTVTTDPEATQ